ncbi:MAG: cryptochrome/photolyase family protein [Vicingaceae bacterium]
MGKTLRLILGDQLNQHHSWYSKKSNDVTYVMMEVEQEANYVNHHIQKIVAFFLAMRSFKKWLESEGNQVIYYKLNDKNNQQAFDKNLTAIIKEQEIEKFEYQLPDEYRLDEQLKKFTAQLSINSEAMNSEHFFTSRTEMKDFFEKKKSKSWLMESFYRHMRKKHKVLIEEDENPIGGDWNYDKSNRKKLPKNHEVISPKLYKKEVERIVESIDDRKIKTIGKIDASNFIWPTSRKESLDLLDFFVKECLPLFGDFQDAMAEGEWSVYHSRLSFAMNSKMLSPKEVINRVVDHWKSNQESIDISQVEGFVRQIIGWREYMRGIYWAKMPEYSSENQLNHRRQLPDFYWTGKTKMNCMSQAINQSLDYAYAHHIQRLMITGNFALLANIKPDEVDAWYLGVYIDAIQWVELPNTRGMSQFADGGLVATKPYVSSANYINKMSNYCGNCFYSHSKKTGEKACPFNSLYWNFIDRHLEKWEKNQRMSMMAANWKKQASENKEAILKQAEGYLKEIDEL